jgi:hypothetical protein
LEKDLSLLHEVEGIGRSLLATFASVGKRLTMTGSLQNLRIPSLAVKFDAERYL